MRHHTLREIAKVAVGLVLADLISVLWLSGAGFFPLTLFGITFSASAIGPIVVLDVALLMILAHTAWSMKLPIESPSERTLLYGVSVVFLVVALLHLSRLAFGWGLALGSFDVPEWVSWVGVLIPLYLSYSSFHFAKRSR